MDQEKYSTVHKQICNTDLVAATMVTLGVHWYFELLIEPEVPFIM